MDLVSSAIPDLDEDIEKLEALSETEIEKIRELVEKTDGDRFKNETEAKETMFSLYKRIDISNTECSICTASPIGIGRNGRYHLWTHILSQLFN